MLRAEYYLEKAIECAAKEVGEIGVSYISKDLITIRDEIIANTPFILAKIIDIPNDEKLPRDAYVQCFLNGKLMMSRLGQYSDLANRDASSNNDFRGDTLEGFSESFVGGYNPHLYSTNKNGDIERDGEFGLIDVLKLRERVLCLTAIEYEEQRQCFIMPDERLKQFGKYVVIIKDSEEFIRRVEASFDGGTKNNGDYWLSYGRVGYGIDTTQRFLYSVFRKSASYSYQKEFRIAIDFSNGKFSDKIMSSVTDFAKTTFPGKIVEDTDMISTNDGMFFLEVGDLRDICEVITTDEFFGSQKNIIPDDTKAPTILKPYQTEREPRPTFCRSVCAVVNGNGNVCLSVSKRAYFSVVL